VGGHSIVIAGTHGLRATGASKAGDADPGSSSPGCRSGRLQGGLWAAQTSGRAPLFSAAQWAFFFLFWRGSPTTIWQLDSCGASTRPEAERQWQRPTSGQAPRRRRGTFWRHNAFARGTAGREGEAGSSKWCTGSGRNRRGQRKKTEDEETRRAGLFREDGAGGDRDGDLVWPGGLAERRPGLALFRHVQPRGDLTTDNDTR